MRGYVSCERCGWSRIYARFSVARLPQFCPQCGRRVVRERNPGPDSPGIVQWRHVAEDLTRESPPPPGAQR
jgi:hypothetical protein